jgi:hypothetical protein
MSAAKLSNRSKKRLKGLIPADHDDIVSAAMLKAFEAGADPAAELDDKYVKLAAQSFRDADNAANGKPSRYGRAKGEAGLRRDYSDGAEDGVADSPAPFNELLASLTPKERKALIRVEVSTIAPAVARSIKKKIADAAPAGFGDTVPPAQSPGEPADRAPAQLDSDPGMLPHAPQGGSGKKCCASRCWQCSYDQGFMPDLTSILRTDRADADVQDVETLVNWRKIAIANAHSNTPRIAWHLFDFPLVVDGRDIPDSVLTAYLPAVATDRWGKWRSTDIDRP